MSLEIARALMPVALLVTVAGCGLLATAPRAPEQPVTALVGGRVQPEPGTAAIPDGVVLVRGVDILAHTFPTEFDRRP